MALRMWVLGRERVEQDGQHVRVSGQQLLLLALLVSGQRDEQRPGTSYRIGRQTVHDVLFPDPDRAPATGLDHPVSDLNAILQGRSELPNVGRDRYGSWVWLKPNPGGLLPDAWLDAELFMMRANEALRSPNRNDLRAVLLEFGWPYFPSLQDHECMRTGPVAGKQMALIAQRRQLLDRYVECCAADSAWDAAEATLGELLNRYTQDEDVAKTLDALKTGRKERTIAGSIASVAERAEIAEQTYFRYRGETVPLIRSAAFIKQLAEHYRCEPLKVAEIYYPVTVLWSNTDRLISPDAVLGHFDDTPPVPRLESAVLNPDTYERARAFIKVEFEAGPIKYEGCNYRMTHINIANSVPKIDGAFGLYYDNILTQYALEWEMKKALIGYAQKPDRKLLEHLPLRQSVESFGNPLFHGNGRCAAITVSTFTVFRRSDEQIYCLIWKRSRNVGVSPGMLHVAPSGMFEAQNTQDAWSVEINVWRELLEEVYNEAEERGAGDARLSEYVQGKPPIRQLLVMLERGDAELSVTGICCDLLNLRPEICTVLYIDDPSFSRLRSMHVDWEYERMTSSESRFAVKLDNIDEVIGRGHMVPSGAASLTLGREWLSRRYKT